ncbi:hypothetical protein DFH09DRAFT_1069330 [Mycena vulgaris]|nr:hypothetical protein DFH09DRAFT_1069330 [Mycena vulgaris]
MAPILRSTFSSSSKDPDTNNRDSLDLSPPLIALLALNGALSLSVLIWTGPPVLWYRTARQPSRRKNLKIFGELRTAGLLRSTRGSPRKIRGHPRRLLPQRRNRPQISSEHENAI